jgi:apolipoprotein N-acyltransferase
MQISRQQFLLLSVLGGGLLGISFPFTGGLSPLAFIALAPLLLINFELNKRVKEPFFTRIGYNYIYFFMYNAITTWWIYNASEGGMWMALLCNSLLMIIPLSLTGIAARNLGENKGLLTFVVLWLSFEYGHYYWELSWPWLSFGHVFANTPWVIQWYEYSGVTGGTLWILLVNIAAYYILRNVWIKKEKWSIQLPIFVSGGLVLILPIISSLIIYATYEEEIDPVNIVVVQPNIDAYTEKFSTPLNAQMDKIFALAETKITNETDLVVCPETAISRPVNEAALTQEPVIKKIQEFSINHGNVPLLIGADGYRIFDHEYSLASRYYPQSDFWVENYNSAFLIEPYKPTQIYHKAKAVLGAEKVPFLSWFPSLKQYSVKLGGTEGMIGLGEEPLNLKTDGRQFAPLICYESVYGDYVSYFTARGADILCVITNDGWWKDTPGYKQHRSFSRIRAIENRRSVARSANTGISCFIDQRGNVIDELLWDVEGAMAAQLNRNQEITFFVRYGDVIGRVSLFLAIALLIYAISTFFKTRKSPFQRKTN